ncbi:hypothetical protein Snoj_79450 [Streptomyces nojiriensis]|uniref:Secreted protein n=1 Tax=Streptomyces nojiriensis TaxID=66374 RepID=A0ABQ3T1H6_9ACTN|nr:hypothetical protein [Streptomyces nojiriensis]QTI47529.1 hypothetical protein JYK04_05378 [Streptomyces nojiriensis]GGR77421.1 hypothetical protein GCM10010205_02860 [Streptomyces nojiriensis]GHI74027.1 hypothetical protein Snoj_79450 [Streptomyces nojiriensis]
MSIRHTVKVRRGAAVTVAAVMALTLAGCGGGDDPKSKDPQRPSAPQSQGAGSQVAPSQAQSSAPPPVIATVDGANGMVLTINSATRDAGGFLTVNGQLKNNGKEPFVGTSAWRGNELTQSGESVAGATLVDKAAKKRYYVLRDTDGRCLCTTGISSVGAGQTVPIFIQFPAPPTSTTEVEFSLPTFATAVVKVSG